MEYATVVLFSTILRVFMNLNVINPFEKINNVIKFNSEWHKVKINFTNLTVLPIDQLKTNYLRHKHTHTHVHIPKKKHWSVNKSKKNKLNGNKIKYYKSVWCKVCLSARNQPKKMHTFQENMHFNHKKASASMFFLFCSCAAAVVVYFRR